MTGITESNNWANEVRRFEPEDVVTGGEGSVDNLVLEQLASRCNWLRLMITALCTAESVPVVNNQTTQFLTALDSRIASAIAGLVDSSPAALDTLNELAAALGDDANFATTMTNALAAKAKWSVIDHIIAAAGLTPDHSSDVQFKSALDNLYTSGQGVKYLSTGTALPTSNIGPIWHDGYNSIMTWQVFNANGADYTGYASVLVGNMLFDTQQTPRPGYFKTGTANLSRVTYAAVRGWAKHNGIFVADNIWAAGDIAICDNPDGATFKAYDLRAQFPRIWDDSRGVDIGRAFGKKQAASLIATAIGADALHQLVVEGSTNNTATDADFNAAMGTDPINDSDYSATLKGLCANPSSSAYTGNSAGISANAVFNRPLNNNTGVKVGGSRPMNTPFVGMVKF